jgi:glutamate dehydrogenase/leucine dehydrogenase
VFISFSNLLNMSDVLARLAAFEHAPAEICFEWNDTPTGAQGWVVINSLRGGAAGGGTRMRIGLDKHEVTSLAKTMEVKFSVAGPAIGGAKSGINFDPADPRKTEVLKRWYKAVAPLLKAYYGTGGDLNVDEVHEVIPISELFGVEHPQEGVLVGHFQPSPSDRQAAIGRLRAGVSKVVTDPRFTPDKDRSYVVADLITGYGVTRALHHHARLAGTSLEGKRMIIQGWGNVAAVAAYYAALEGALVVGIIDREGGLMKVEGYGLDEVRALLLHREGNKLTAPGIIPFKTVNDQVWDVPCDIFVPGAASRLVTQAQAERLVAAGCQWVSCGANVPFSDSEIFYGPIARYADANMAVLPDFIANCGMARTFAYLMQPGAELTDQAIFEDVDRTIQTAIERVWAENKTERLLTETAYGQALSDLGV